MIQDKNGVIAAAPSSVPDRHFRNAWMFDSAQDVRFADKAHEDHPNRDPHPRSTPAKPGNQ